MSARPPDAPTDGHPAEVRRIHQRLLEDAGLSGSTVHTANGARVHVVTKGAGRPVVLIHGSGSPGLFWLPLVARLDGMCLIVVDRPGFGLSDPVPAADTPRRTATEWIGRLLDALGLDSATLVGHSMGGLWSLHFALARPERVTGLAMVGTPSLPGTRAPLPFRLMGTPGVRELIARQTETPRSVHQFAARVGEGDTIGDHPGLVDLLVASGNDPVAKHALHQEVRALITPWALLSRTGFRRTERVTGAHLLGLQVPTLLVGGDHDPVGGGDVTRGLRRVIPHAEVEVVDGGHAPWLGQGARVATALTAWVDGLAP